MPLRKEPAFHTRYQFGNIELVECIYFRGKSKQWDIAFCGLGRQQQAFIRILCEDGRRIWERDDFNRVIMSRIRELRSNIEPTLLTKELRGTMQDKGFLRKITYEEFVLDEDLRSRSTILWDPYIYTRNKTT